MNENIEENQAGNCVAPDQKELTFGEKMVGKTFNPGGDPKVDKIKALYAEIIDTMNEVDNCEISKMKAGFHNTANEQAVIAQMSAIKFITCKY